MPHMSFSIPMLAIPYKTCEPPKTTNSQVSNKVSSKKTYIDYRFAMVKFYY